MIRPDLPVVALADLPGGPDPVVLCASARLAVDLRRAHGASRANSGAATWRALQSSTPALFLDALVSRALLRGEIPPEVLAGVFLGAVQERNLWELAIARDAGAAAGLFDREGMALAGMEAAGQQRQWRLEVPDALHTEEYRAYLRWRDDVALACRKGGWRGIDDILGVRIGCVERGIGGLPKRVGIAGFVLPDPQTARLLQSLEARGVHLFRVDFGHPRAAQGRAVGCADTEAECRAAADWARRRLAAAGPGTCRLRIAVAGLAVRRRRLDAALADALGGPGGAAYEFIDGEPLAGQPLIATALALLHTYAFPRRIAQADLGPLLCAPGWSSDVDEADRRAAIEAGLRQTLPAETTLEHVHAAIGRLPEGRAAPALLDALGAILEAARQARRRQTASAWAEAFLSLLERVGWPGQRPLTSGEAAATLQFREVVLGLARLDGILGRVDRGEALRQVRGQCRDLPFRRPRPRSAAVEVCDLDDAVAGAVDGLWVMGLNEGDWPPGPRPNPLLPAELQRRAGIPSARADLLAAAARERQALWLASAPEVIASWARQEGERPLRPSPLLTDMAAVRAEFPAPALPTPARMEYVDDHQAPPLSAAEEVRGGTALLAAQAACPAWAFHHYRLGAAVLPTPTFGLDALARGRLLHRALEVFWHRRGLDDLVAMDVATRARETERVVALALEAHERRAGEPLPERLRALEAARLGELLATWLSFESTRGPFRVRACEERHRLDIEGVGIDVVVDRVDELEDGRLAIIDYKSGRSDRSASWAAARIAEPQLPIYAALAFPDREVVAVALARVVREDAAFLGVAAADELLPGVGGLESQRRRYPAADFPDWNALRLLWAERLRAVAREFRDGLATVSVDDAKDLAYCPVLPLLRLAEREAQAEAAGS